jgi:hypothetical protein
LDVSIIPALTTPTLGVGVRTSTSTIVLFVLEEAVSWSKGVGEGEGEDDARSVLDTADMLDASEDWEVDSGEMISA